MKYSTSKKPLVCMQTQSTCYKGTSKMTIKGILWHSTGANNPNLKRYVQPSDVKPAADTYTKDKWIEVIGKNNNKNDMNHINREMGMNAWIGKLANGDVASIQTMPWDFKPWGCASGSKGSCNNGWIQFEICEDGLNDKKYFEAIYKEACELTAYLCKINDLNPKGTVKMNGVTVPVILCHADSHKLGLGSNHGDIYHWFKKYGKDMDDVRNDVAKLIEATKIQSNKKEESTEKTETVKAAFKVGEKVRLLPGAKWSNNVGIQNWVFKTDLYVRENRKNGEVLVSTQKTGACTGVVNQKYLVSKTLNQTATSNAPTNKNFKSYLVIITTSSLNVRNGASTKYKVNTTVKKGQVYTIVDEKDGWGKLKSGAGWIYLDGYTKKLK